MRQVEKKELWVEDGGSLLAMPNQSITTTSDISDVNDLRQKFSQIQLTAAVAGGASSSKNIFTYANHQMIISQQPRSRIDLPPDSFLTCGGGSEPDEAPFLFKAIRDIDCDSDSSLGSITPLSRDNSLPLSKGDSFGGSSQDSSSINNTTAQNQMMVSITTMSNDCYS